MTESPKSLLIEPAAFWFVWTKNRRVPRFAHPSQAAAEAEAVRLAGLHPGRKFIVLRAENKFSVAAQAQTQQVAQ